MLHTSLGSCICLLLWKIMKKLDVLPGEFVFVENVNLQKATFVKLKFRDGTFGELSNPRAMYFFTFCSIVVWRTSSRTSPL